VNPPHAVARLLHVTVIEDTLIVSSRCFESEKYDSDDRNCKRLREFEEIDTCISSTAEMVTVNNKDEDS
jgi:hypothetical protein